MKPGSFGNGTGKFDIHVDDLGGWVRVFPSRFDDVPENLPIGLSCALAEWCRQHPQFRVRTIVPINKDGDTIELHAWYDMVIFPSHEAAQPIEDA